MKEAITVISIAALLIAIVVSFAFLVKSKSCDNQSVSFEDHEFKFFGGCMVLHKGKWIPLENIRGFD